MSLIRPAYGIAAGLEPVSASSIDADHPPDATLVSLETGC